MAAELLQCDRQFCGCRPPSSLYSRERSSQLRIRGLDSTNPPRRNLPSRRSPRIRSSKANPKSPTSRRIIVTALNCPGVVSTLTTVIYALFTQIPVVAQHVVLHLINNATRHPDRRTAPFAVRSGGIAATPSRSNIPRCSAIPSSGILPVLPQLPQNPALSS